MSIPAVIRSLGSLLGSLLGGAPQPRPIPVPSAPRPPAPRRATSAALALAAGLAASALTPGARAVINGQSAPRNDRRFDCVGLVKSDTCYSCCISGSCVLIDAGQMQGNTLVRGARVLMSDHSLRRGWGTTRFRFRRAVNGDCDGDYPGIDTLNHCAGNYQELAMRVVNGEYQVQFAGHNNPMAVVELDGVVRNIRPAIISPLSPTDQPGGIPLVLAGWGATDTAGTQGMWALRVGRPMLAPPSPRSGQCLGGCDVNPLDCPGCIQFTLYPENGPFDSTCSGLTSEHDSGAGVFVELPNPNSDEQSGGDLSLIGIGSVPVSQELSKCWTYIPTVWLWNHLATTTDPQLPLLPIRPQPATGGLSDYDRNGAVDILDIFAFLQGWFDGRPTADVAAPQGVDLLDIFAFLQAWFALR